MAGSFLFKITEFAVKGAGMGMIMEFSALLLPGVMAKTFPMAVLLAALLAFGRLSGESELVALRAQGISLWRIMLPVAAFGLAVSILAFGFNEILVPQAAMRATDLESQIKKNIEGSQTRTTSYAVMDKGHLAAQIMARDFNYADGVLTGALIATYTPNGTFSTIVLADRLKYVSDKEWKIEGRAQLFSVDAQSMVTLQNGFWPTEVPKTLVTPDEIRASNQKDLDAYSMQRMGELIATAIRNPKVSRDQVGNLQYGYWNKLALPFAALVYALVGAPLGIRNHRSGAATGFWMAVLIIFAYLMVGNFMSLWARGGVLPAWVAAFTPLLIGLIIAAVTIQRRN